MPSAGIMPRRSTLEEAFLRICAAVEVILKRGLSEGW